MALRACAARPGGDAAGVGKTQHRRLVRDRAEVVNILQKPARVGGRGGSAAQLVKRRRCRLGRRRNVKARGRLRSTLAWALRTSTGAKLAEVRMIDLFHFHLRLKNRLGHSILFF